MNKYIGYLLLLLIVVTESLIYTNIINNKNKTINQLNNEIEYYKQAANPSKEIIDSLVYNITYRDSIIYEHKIQYINDVETIKNTPDSSIVDLFYKSVWAD